jgi:hypothetical protein
LISAGARRFLAPSQNAEGGRGTKIRVFVLHSGAYWVYKGMLFKRSQIPSGSTGVKKGAMQVEGN